MRRILATSLLSILFVTLSAGAETFWEDTITYDPPADFTGSEQPGNAGIPMTGRDYLPVRGSHPRAQITFVVKHWMLMYDHSTPPRPIKSISELKALIDKQLSTSTSNAVPTPRGELVDFAGRKAVRMNTKTADEDGKQLPTQVFFLPWEQGTVLEIFFVAESDEDFQQLRKSLATVKLNPHPDANLKAPLTRP